MKSAPKMADNKRRDDAGRHDPRNARSTGPPRDRRPDRPHDRRDGPSSRSQGPPRNRDDNGGHREHSRFAPEKMPSGAAFNLEIPRKKFTGRCRLFVGNLPNEMKEDEMKKMFEEFGPLNECYISGKGFGFVRLDTRSHAESAKEALDGATKHGRQIRVRFAVHGATIRVKELSSVVSNEMLYHTFSIFGEVERAIHVVDERGKPTGEGIIEFERKSSAQEALRAIEDRVFMMTASSRPLRLEIMEPKDEEDGLSERMIQRTVQTTKEREKGPRFAEKGTFEFEYGKRWKELYIYEKERREGLEKELVERRKQLEADMEIAMDEFRAQKIREELEQRQRELERLEANRRERGRQVGRYEEPSNSWNTSAQYEEPKYSMQDGPQGRAATYGREPDYYGGGQPVQVSQIDPYGAPPIDPMAAYREDPLQAGVQRSLNQSLGFGADVPPQQIYGAPLDQLAMNPMVAAQSFNSYNPNFGMQNMMNDYRPPDKRRR